MPQGVAGDTFATWNLPPSWRAVDFISDLHLSPALPRTFAAWRAHLLETTADAVIMLGDLFEVWVGDDARHLPFEAACVATMHAAAQRVTLALMVGNRDFLIGDELLRDSAARGLVDPTVIEAFGQRVLVSHGDAWCLDDAEYQHFRSLVRGQPWQSEFLARPLAERQRIAADIRSRSETRKRFDGASNADVDVAAASAVMRSAGAPVLVHGHTHRPFSGAFGASAVRHVLTDWDLDQGQRAELLRWTRDGLRRIAPEGDAGPANAAGGCLPRSSFGPSPRRP